ncbi:hypothetical protein ACLOJK_032952 [Asimina triloba]
MVSDAKVSCLREQYLPSPSINGLINTQLCRADCSVQYCSLTPLDATCSSSYLNPEYSENLLVPNGSYALTALNCVQCTCGPNDLTLRCHPAPLAMSCSNFKCGSSNLSIGDAYVQPTSSGCNLISCLYRGHKGHTILNG